MLFRSNKSFTAIINPNLSASFIPFAGLTPLASFNPFTKVIEENKTSSKLVSTTNSEV
jgi:hypothetical protein